VLRQLIERVSAKAVAVTIVVVIVVIVVPATVLSVAPGDDSAVRGAAAASHARTQPTATPKKVPPRVKFKFDSEDLIAALRSAEAACLASLTALTTSSGLTVDQSKPILDNARARLDIGVVPLVIRVRADEYEVARARTLTPQQLAVYVTEISSVRLSALGTGDKQGSIAVVCSTLTAQVQQQIAILKPPPAPSGDGDDSGD
jgi:hypothetical protein